jgi:hypothetical protein
MNENNEVMAEDFAKSFVDHRGIGLGPERVTKLALHHGERCLDVREKMMPKNEHGNRRAKLWQGRTVDTGIPHLDRQITADLTLVQISEKRTQFDLHWQRLFARQKELLFAGSFQRNLSHDFMCRPFGGVSVLIWRPGERICDP